MPILIYSENVKEGGEYIIEIDNVSIRHISISRLKKLKQEIERCIGKEAEK